MHHIEIAPTRLGPAGRTYAVHYRGRAAVREPDARVRRLPGTARITGRLEVWLPGRLSSDLQLDIERGAGLTISETEAQLAARGLFFMQAASRRRPWVATPGPMGRPRLALSRYCAASQPGAAEGLRLRAEPAQRCDRPRQDGGAGRLP
jgi:hypothetical protein